MDKVTVSQFKEHVRSKDELYDMLVRNKFFLPKLSSTMVTEDYMTSVMLLQTTCPKYSEIRLSAAPSLPIKEVLIAKLEAIAKSNHWNFGFSEKGKPDKQWLV